MLVGLQTNRETAHLVGENFSRGCTFANSWRDYPFLRMPNVHLEPGPANSPTRDELIADVKNGVMIDGRGSYSIDQQRYNGQFGGHIFWEIKNGKITRQVTDVTYNAITTDFWGNLDGITGPSEYQKFGTGGDAKGQPTQTNSISHGSPWLLIRKIMVGAAFDWSGKRGRAQSLREAVGRRSARVERGPSGRRAASGNTADTAGQYASGLCSGHRPRSPTEWRLAPEGPAGDVSEAPGGPRAIEHAHVTCCGLPDRRHRAMRWAPLECALAMGAVNAERDLAILPGSIGKYCRPEATETCASPSSRRHLLSSRSLRPPLRLARQPITSSRTRRDSPQTSCCPRARKRLFFQS